MDNEDDDGDGGDSKATTHAVENAPGNGKVALTAASAPSPAMGTQFQITDFENIGVGFVAGLAEWQQLNWK